jgi:hypothetical protein
MIITTETKRDGAGNEVKEQKFNYLAAAEMSAEDNFNQLDGVLNNTTKPTFQERMTDAENKAQEHNRQKSKKRKDAER